MILLDSELIWITSNQLQWDADFLIDFLMPCQGIAVVHTCIREVKKGASKTNEVGSKFRPSKEAQGISLEQIQLTGSAKQNLG